MDNLTADRFSMFGKTLDFLNVKDAVLAINPAIIALRGEFSTLIDDIIKHEGAAQKTITGAREKRNESRTKLIASMMKVSSALFAYWLVAGLKVELRLSDYTQRELMRRPEGNLYLRATKLHELADPVKALLAPYNCLPADVDALFNRKKEFFDDVELPKKMRKERSNARKKVTALMKQGTEILKTVDIHMATFQWVKPPLFAEYALARAIDKLHRKERKKTNEQALPQPV